MLTVFFYNFILLSSTFFVWLSEKGRTRLDRWILLSIAFLLVFLPSALRYDIGTDYVHYLAIYEGKWHTPLADYKNNEPLFYFINSLLKHINAHFQWVFATLAFIFTVVVFKAYPRKKTWLFHFLMIVILWFPSFNIIRQAIAVAFCILAVTYYIDKRYLFFVLYVFVAAQFHKSALLLLLLGATAAIPFGYYLKTRVVPFVFVVTIALSAIGASYILSGLESALSLFGMSSYAGYFGGKFFVKPDFGSGLGALAKVLFSTYIILNTKRLLQINKSYWILILTCFIYAVVVILAHNVIIFNRLSYVFIYGPILSAYFLYGITTTKNINKIVISIYLVFLFLTFIKLGVGTETSISNPKTNPYKVIFIGDSYS